MVRQNANIFIRARGKDYGPFREEEVTNLMSAGSIPFAAWIFQNDTWQRLATLDALIARHPEYEVQPQGVPDQTTAKTTMEMPKELLNTRAANAAALSSDAVWFFIRDKKKFGPYAAGDLIGQVQRKELTPSAFVWRPGFSTWQRMSQVAEFSAHTLKSNVKNLEKVDILVKRKYVRAPYEVEIIAHDNSRAIEGKSMVIGEGGLFLATARPFHAVGVRLKLHFREGGAQPFNAIAEVVSVVRGDSSGYCMRFVALSDSDRRRIAKYVTENK